MLRVKPFKFFKAKIPNLQVKSMDFDAKKAHMNSSQATNFKSNPSINIFTSWNKKNLTSKLNCLT